MPVGHQTARQNYVVEKPAQLLPEAFHLVWNRMRLDSTSTLLEERKGSAREAQEHLRTELRISFKGTAELSLTALLGS